MKPAIEEIFARHGRINRLLWGSGAIPGTVLGPMDSEQAHKDRGALLSMLTPEQRGDESGLATVMEIVAVMDKALRDIDDYSAGSTIQPVQIAREALRRLYGPNYRSNQRENDHG